MSERYFSRDEVEALIPELEAALGEAMVAHAETRAIREEMRAEQRRIGLSGGGLLDAVGWRVRRERLEALGRQVQQGLDAVVRLGGVPKDLDLGLVDFPGLRGGQLVNLCWRQGERRVEYWHGLDEGFAGRKPL